MKWKNWVINPWNPEDWGRGKRFKKIKVSPLSGEAKRINEINARFGLGIFLNKDQGLKDANPFKCPYAFIARLRKRGYHQLGAGCFSTVLYKSGDRVIKVNRSPDAWLDYVLWASKKGYAGGLAPKVFSYKKIGNFYVAVMEKIDYCAHKVESTQDAWMYPQLLTYAAMWKNNKAADLLDICIPGAKRFTYDLRDEFTGHRLDLHNENIMFRADGSMVIVDPVSHQSNLNGVIRLKARDFGLLPAG